MVSSRKNKKKRKSRKRPVFERIKERPDPFEQALWAIYALFFSVSFLCFDVVGIVTLAVFFSLLITATMFWSYVVGQR